MNNNYKQSKMVLVIIKKKTNNFLFKMKSRAKKKFAQYFNKNNNFQTKINF